MTVKIFKSFYLCKISKLLLMSVDYTKCPVLKIRKLSVVPMEPFRIEILIVVCKFSLFFLTYLLNNKKEKK